MDEYEDEDEGDERNRSGYKKENKDKHRHSYSPTETFGLAREEFQLIFHWNVQHTQKLYSIASCFSIDYLSTKLVVYSRYERKERKNKTKQELY